MDAAVMSAAGSPAIEIAQPWAPGSLNSGQVRGVDPGVVGSASLDVAASAASGASPGFIDSVAASSEVASASTTIGSMWGTPASQTYSPTCASKTQAASPTLAIRQVNICDRLSARSAGERTRTDRARSTRPQDVPTACLA